VEAKSEKTRTYFTFALAAVAVVGGFVLAALGKLDALEQLLPLVIAAIGGDAATSIGYAASRAVKKSAESKAKAVVAEAAKNAIAASVSGAIFSDPK